MPHEFLGTWQSTLLGDDASTLNPTQEGTIEIKALNDNGSGLAGKHTPKGGQSVDITGSATPAGSGPFVASIHIDGPDPTGKSETFDGFLVAKGGQLVIVGVNTTIISPLTDKKGRDKKETDEQAQSIWVATKP